MTTKRRIKFTISDDIVEWTIVKFKEDGIIFLTKCHELRLENSDQNGEEAELEEGDTCLAKYLDGQFYDAKILLKTDDKEKAMKQKKIFEKVEKEKRKTKVQTRKQTERKEDDNELATCSTNNRSRKVQKGKTNDSDEDDDDFEMSSYNKKKAKVQKRRTNESDEDDEDPVTVGSAEKKRTKVQKRTKKRNDEDDDDTTKKKKKEERGRRTEVQEDAHLEPTRSYYPRTRPRLKFADYYVTDPKKPEIREGYQQLAPGASIAVDALWLHEALSSVRGKDTGTKTPKGEAIIKKLIDGFYDLKDLAVPGGTSSFLDSPVYNSIRLYAEHHLKMSATKHNIAWNEKLSSARKTKRRLEREQT